MQSGRRKPLFRCFGERSPIVIVVMCCRLRPNSCCAIEFITSIHIHKPRHDALFIRRQPPLLRLLQRQQHQRQHRRQHRPVPRFAFCGVSRPDDVTNHEQRTTQHNTTQHNKIRPTWSPARKRLPRRSMIRPTHLHVLEQLESTLGLGLVGENVIKVFFPACLGAVLGLECTLFLDAFGQFLLHGLLLC